MELKIFGNKMRDTRLRVDFLLLSIYLYLYFSLLKNDYGFVGVELAFMDLEILISMI